MQITLATIAEIETNVRAAEALRVGHAAYPSVATEALRAALAFLEERRKAIPEIDAIDLFGETMTAKQWGILQQDNNDAQVRVIEIARAIGIDIR